MSPKRSNKESSKKKANLLEKKRITEISNQTVIMDKCFFISVSPPSVYCEDPTTALFHKSFENKFIHTSKTSGIEDQQRKRFVIYKPGTRFI